MTTKVRSMLLVLAVVLVVSACAGVAFGAKCFEEEYFDTGCFLQCNYVLGGWWCDTADDSRCCWQSGTGSSCGEATIDACPECDTPGDCGF